jgi:hypothetical protein
MRVHTTRKETVMKVMFVITTGTAAGAIQDILHEDGNDVQD